MSQTGTPTEFLQLGITEPDDTLNVLVDLNGQWRKIDTGVKNVDIKATTNAGNITTLQGAVQDNTENITNILDTNVNQQNSIDTLQTKVAALEEDDTSYGSRITAVENGVQENSELINDLEVDLSGVKLDVGTVPSGSNLQGEVDGLDTRVTALENSGSVAAVEARVTTLEGSVSDIEDTIGTVPSGETVQGQINGLDTDVTTLQGQVNSGNIPFRFSVDGGGNYGYLKADDSFVPFSVGGNNHWHELDTTLFNYDNESSMTQNQNYSYIMAYRDYRSSSSPYYMKLHDFINDVDYTLPSDIDVNIYGRVILNTGSSNTGYILTNNGYTAIGGDNGDVAGVIYDNTNKYTHLLTRNVSNRQYKYMVIGPDGVQVGQTVTYTLSYTPVSPVYFVPYKIYYRYHYNGNDYSDKITFNTETGSGSSSSTTDRIYAHYNVNGSQVRPVCYYDYQYGLGGNGTNTNNVVFELCPHGTFMNNVDSTTYYYI